MDYDTLQSRPFGTNTALSGESLSLNGTPGGGVVGNQYRLQSAAYGQALRLLDRRARAGDAGAAIQAIGVRDAANNSGFAPGTIQDQNAINQAGVGRASAMEQRNTDLTNTGRLQRAVVSSNLGWIGKRNSQWQQVGQQQEAAKPPEWLAPVSARTPEEDNALLAANSAPPSPSASTTSSPSASPVGTPYSTGNPSPPRVMSLVDRALAGVRAGWNAATAQPSSY